MTRRQFLAASATIPAAASALELPKRLPPALKPGDAVAIVSPAGALDDEMHHEKCLQKVTELGFKPVPGPNSLKRHGYLGGTDQQRADDLNWAFSASEIKGVFCTRGGYGAMRLLPKLSYGLIQRNPKVIIGYSDISALHLAIHAKCGVVTFHGPCAESSWTEFSRNAFEQVCLKGETPTITLNAPETLVPGVAKGLLVGGNLSLVAAMNGTPYLPSLRGAIVFLEDIGEDPYRVDRMLTSLILQGDILQSAGIIFGNFRARGSTPAPDPNEDPTKTFSLNQVLKDRCNEIAKPAITGGPFGHMADNHVMPVGTEATLNTLERTFRFEKPSVLI